jgi:plastocyanin
MKGAVPLTLALLSAAAPAHAAAERNVDIPGKRFTPPRLSIVRGDTVTWTNRDFFTHDIASLDGSFRSGRLNSGATFAHTFATPGSFAYRCTLHPFMAGQVDVAAFSLNGPLEPTPAGRPALLHGLAPQGAQSVAIEQASADGAFHVIGHAVTRADGSFAYTVVPAAPAVFRAVAGGEASPPLALPVSARLELAVHRSRGGRVTLRATASPDQAGARAALQVYSRERFDWRRIARGRLDTTSGVSFKLRPRRRLRVRVALVRGVGGYAPAVSRPLTVRPRQRSRPIARSRRRQPASAAEA